MCSNLSQQKADIVIRKLAVADHAQVSRLAQAAALFPDDNAYPIVMLDKELRGEAEAPPDNREVFGAFAGERLVATGCVTLLEGGTGWLSRMYVDPALRRAGIASRLVEFLESRFKELGCGTVTLDFRGTRHTTQLFWMRMGYSRMGTFTHPRLPGAFVVIARKAL